MKKIFKGLFVFLFLVLLAGCAKDYKATTTDKFIDAFSNDSEYLLNTHTPIYDTNIERSTAVSGKGIQYLFFEFDTEKNAKSYVKTNYKGIENYKYKDYSDYVEVKSTKGRYFRLVQVDKTVISGYSDTKSDKKEINRIFKKLGY